MKRPRHFKPWIILEKPGKIRASQGSEVPKLTFGGSEDSQRSDESAKRQKKKKKRKKKSKMEEGGKEDKSSKRRALELTADEERESLLITVAGSGGGGRDKPTRGAVMGSNIPQTPASLHRPVALLKTPMTPPNHVYPSGSKRPLIVSTSPDFPREPHSPHNHLLPDPYSRLEPPPKRRGRWDDPPPPHRYGRDPSPSSHRDTPPYYQHRGHGREDWHHDDSDHALSPSYEDPREHFSRRYSLQEPRHGLLISPQRRRQSEDVGHHAHHHHGRARPYPDHMRSDMVSSNRGFQMSEHRARQVGGYHDRETDRSPASNRRTYHQKY